MPRLTDRDGGWIGKKEKEYFGERDLTFQFSLSSVVLAVLVKSVTDCSLQQRA